MFVFTWKSSFHFYYYTWKSSLDVIVLSLLHLEVTVAPYWSCLNFPSWLQDTFKVKLSQVKEVSTAANFSPLAETSLIGTKKGPIYNKIRDQIGTNLRVK